MMNISKKGRYKHKTNESAYIIKLLTMSKVRRLEL